MSAIVADGFDRAGLHRFAYEGELCLGVGLVMDEIVIAGSV